MENEPNFQSKLQRDVKEKETMLLSSSPFLSQMLETQSRLFENASKEIVFSPPLVSWNGVGVFRKGTINVIQGKFGSHKSRFAELICSLLLAKNVSNTHFLGFDKDRNVYFALIYIDTERNLDEEVPATIQNIREKAGEVKTEMTPHFYVTSVKKFERKDRLDSVKEWIEYVKNAEEKVLFVVLDVVTDCAEDFNNAGQSMALFDFLGNLCDDFGATFLLVIHENPASEKARGHIGTEAANKASSVMQISIEDEEKGLIKLKFIKLRGAARPQPIFMNYCPEAKGLILAPDEMVKSSIADKKSKMDISLVKEQIELILTKPMTQQEVCATLTKFFERSESSVKNRLKQLENSKEVFLNGDAVECTLESDHAVGKTKTYFLKPIPLVLPQLPLSN